MTKCLFVCMDSTFAITIVNLVVNKNTSMFRDLGGGRHGIVVSALAFGAGGCEFNPRHTSFFNESQFFFRD